MVERAMVLGVARTIDLADWADVPLAMSANMSEVVAFKACFTVMRMVMRKRCVNG